MYLIKKLLGANGYLLVKQLINVRTQISLGISLRNVVSKLQM